MVLPDNRNAPPNPTRARLSESELRLRNLLKRSPQDLWLDTIRRTRSDAHNGLIHWMLSQPQCDFAIAVHAFYRSNPIDRIANPEPLPPRPGPDNIFAVVLMNWDTGSFRCHNIRVAPQDAHPRIRAQLQQKIRGYPRGMLPFQVPAALLDPQGGTTAKVPPHLSPDNVAEIWSLYTDLGLNVPDEPPGLGRKLAKAKAMLRTVGISR